VALLAICVPVMIVAVAIATVPIIWAIHHHHRYGSGEKPRPQESGGQTARLPRVAVPWSTCPECASVVADLGIHSVAIHRAAA